MCWKLLLTMLKSDANSVTREFTKKQDLYTKQLGRAKILWVELFSLMMYSILDLYVSKIVITGDHLQRHSVAGSMFKTTMGLSKTPLQPPRKPDSLFLLPPNVPGDKPTHPRAYFSR